MRCGFDMKCSLTMIMNFCIVGWNDWFYVNWTCGEIDVWMLSK